MEPNLVLIFGFIIVIFVVMMRVITTATERQMAHKERMAELKKQSAGGGDPQTAARIDNMEQRLRVLERIATDSGSNVSVELAREIEALRHKADVADHSTGVPLDIKEKVL